MDEISSLPRYPVGCRDEWQEDSVDIDIRRYTDHDPFAGFLLGFVLGLSAGVVGTSLIVVSIFQK